VSDVENKMLMGSCESLADTEQIITSMDDQFIAAWNQVAIEAHQMAVEKGFWEKEPNKAEKLALIHSEISECLEGVRKDTMDDKLPHRKMEAVELADAIIRIMDYDAGFGLNIAEALREKMAYNKTRPYKHGKAF
jgi:NTP pyrophosphatase (non-canonical NTP hydrolase)